MSPRTVITIVAVLGLMLPTVFYVWSGINAGIEEEQLKSVVRKASDKSIEKACALTDLADFYLLRNSYERATQEYRNALIIEDALPEKKPAISFMTLTGLAVCLAIERHEESGWFKEDSEVPALVKRATLIADAAGCAQLNGPLPGVVNLAYARYELAHAFEQAKLYGASELLYSRTAKMWSKICSGWEHPACFDDMADETFRGYARLRGEIDRTRILIK